MSRARPAIVPATPALVEAWYGKPAPWTLRGFAAVQDGRPLGLAGVYWIGGTPVGFSEWQPDLDRKTIARAVRLVMGLIDGLGVPVFATAKSEQSARLLARLGFLPTGREALGGPLLVRPGGAPWR
jgi:hypothetical protein